MKPHSFCLHQTTRSPANRERFPAEGKHGHTLETVAVVRRWRRPGRQMTQSNKQGWAGQDNRQGTVTMCPTHPVDVSHSPGRWLFKQRRFKRYLTRIQIVQIYTITPYKREQRNHEAVLIHLKSAVWMPVACTCTSVFFQLQDGENSELHI